MQQLETIKKYFDYIDTIEDTKGLNMNKYYKESASNVWEVDDGFIVLEKPRLETRFCFGAGWCGQATEEEEERASNAANYARTNEDYFRKENLEKIEEEIARIDYCIAKIQGNQEKAHELAEKIDLWNKEIAFYLLKKKDKTYHPKDFEISLINLYDLECKEWKYEHFDLRPLTLDELLFYKQLQEHEKVKLSKRIETYLKRYSTKKLKVWTYVVD